MSASVETAVPKRIDLDAIRARRAAYLASHDHPGAFACCTAHASADDVPALLAEIEVARRMNVSFEPLTEETT